MELLPGIDTWYMIIVTSLRHSVSPTLLAPLRQEISETKLRCEHYGIYKLSNKRVDYVENAGLLFQYTETFKQSTLAEATKLRAKRNSIGEESVFSNCNIGASLSDEQEKLTNSKEHQQEYNISQKRYKTSQTVVCYDSYCESHQKQQVSAERDNRSPSALRGKAKQWHVLRSWLHHLSFVRIQVTIAKRNSPDSQIN